MACAVDSGMLAAAFALAALAAAEVAPPVISEVRLDCLPPMTNVEYIELIGVPGDPLDGLFLVVIGDADSAPGPGLGNSGVIETVIPLGGHAIPAGHALLVHDSPLLAEPPDVRAPVHLEDGDNLTVLLVRGVNALPTEDLDTDDDGVLDLEPWKEIVDGVAFVALAEGSLSEWTYSPNRVGPNGGFFIFHAHRCLDTGPWRIGDFDFTSNPGVESPGRVPPPCSATLCFGDINTDGTCGAADLTIVLTNWGRIGTLGDVDGDGLVDARDVTQILTAWGDCDL